MTKVAMVNTLLSDQGITPIMDVILLTAGLLSIVINAMLALHVRRTGCVQGGVPLADFVTLMITIGYVMSGLIQLSSA